MISVSYRVRWKPAREFERVVSTGVSLDRKTVFEIVRIAKALANRAKSDAGKFITAKEDRAAVQREIAYKDVRGFKRKKTHAQSTIDVALVYANHPASNRWQFGDRKTPATRFMSRGLYGYKSMGILRRVP